MTNYCFAQSACSPGPKSRIHSNVCANARSGVIKGPRIAPYWVWRSTLPPEWWRLGYRSEMPKFLSRMHLENLFFAFRWGRQDFFLMQMYSLGNEGINLGITVWVFKRTSLLSWRRITCFDYLDYFVSIPPSCTSTLQPLLVFFCRDCAPLPRQRYAHLEMCSSLNKLELDAHRSIDIIRSEDPDSNIVAKHPVCEILLFCWHLFH